MCTFISVTLPKTANIDACRNAFSKHQMTLTLMDTTGHPGGILSTENYFFTCAGHCDCGSRLGEKNRYAKPHSPSIEAAMTEDLRKKGWSKTKIERRLSDFKKKNDKDLRAENAYHAHHGDDLVEWELLIKALLKQGLTASIGICVNDYEGPLDDPKFNLTRVKLGKDKLSKQHLQKIAPAELLLLEQHNVR